MAWNYKVNDRRLGPVIARELDQECIENVMEEKVVEPWWKNLKKFQSIQDFKNYMIINPQDHDYLLKEIIQSINSREDMLTIEEVMEEKHVPYISDYSDPYEFQVSSYNSMTFGGVNRLRNDA